VLALAPYVQEEDRGQDLRTLIENALMRMPFEESDWELAAAIVKDLS